MLARLLTRSSRTALFPLLLAAAGCGMVQIQTSSSTGQTAVENQPSEPATPAATATAAATASAAAAPDDSSPEDLGEVALGDLKSPVVRTYKGMRDRTIKLTSPTRRTLQIFTLHSVLWRVLAKPGENSTNWGSRELVVDKEVVLELNTRSNGVTRYPDEEYGIIVYDPKVTEFTTSDVYGVPPADAPLGRKALEKHAPWWSRAHIPRNAFPLDSVTAWLEKIDERFFVFTTAARCNLLEDEPVLIIRYNDISEGYSTNLVRSNGQEVDCRQQEGQSPLFSNSRPAKVALPPPAKAQLPPLPSLWSPEPFLQEAASRPDVAKYAAQKKKAEECSEKAWKRLDPDGRAGRYDVVTRDASGNIVGAESLSKRIGRQVDAACKLGPLWTERAKLLDKWRADQEARSKAATEVVGKRFGVAP